MIVQAYRHGINPPAPEKPHLPEPYNFFYASTAMGLCGLVAMANSRLGLVMAWGIMLGALTYVYEHDKNTAHDTVSNSNPSSLALNNSTQRGTIP